MTLDVTYRRPRCGLPILICETANILLCLNNACCLKNSNPIVSFRYRLTGGPLNSFEVELYLAMRTLSTAYPLATDGDGLIRGLIREIFGKENVIQSDNEVAYAKLFNVQRTAEFCDLSTMNGMFRKALVSLSLCLFWTTPKVYYKCKLIVQHIYFIHDKNSSNVRFKNLNF